MPTVTKDLPRRVHLELQSPAELAIRNAIIEIEKMGADARLTDAQMLLGQAKDKVSDYVDEQPVATPTLNLYSALAQLLDLYDDHPITPEHAAALSAGHAALAKAVSP